MLEHLEQTPKTPRRTVVIGSAGFVGGAITRHLQVAGMPHLALSSKDVDLLADDATAKLSSRLQPEDAVVFVSALAPCKDAATLLKNLRMVEAVCSALAKVVPSHLVNISSDAVYSDDAHPVRESSCADAPSLHGAMHRVREVALRSAVSAPLATLRPSLIYGAADPHNGYGPNRYRRTAAAEGKITLFGEGEEKRDHVFIEDVAQTAVQVLLHRSRGVLNVTSGYSASFREVAEAVAALFAKPVAVIGTPRQNPITHRHFDVTARLKAFPSLHATPLREGLARVHQETPDEESR